MFNYSTKFDLKHAKSVDASSKFAKKTDLVGFKSDVDDLDIDKLKTVPVDLSRLSNVVKNELVKKKDVYGELVKKFNAIQTNDTSNLVKKKLTKTKTIDQIEKKIPNHDKYITTQKLCKLTSENFAARLNQVDLASKNDIVNFVKKIDFDEKLKKINKKVTSNKTK